MKRFHFAVVWIPVVLISFLAGFWYHRHANSLSDDISELRTEEDSEVGDMEDLKAGAVQISADRQQLIGVEVAVVSKEPVVRILRVLGRVEADENLIFRINAGSDGWFQKTYPNSVGSLVQKGEVLATFSTPLLADTMQNYFYAMETAERLAVNKRQLVHRSVEVARGTDDRFILQRQIDLLRGMGVETSQIEEIKKTRQITLDIRITSPATGFITARKVSPGERFEKGDELFRITDLSHVWIQADAFENEAQYFQPGAKLRFRLPSTQKIYFATVSQILPIFDATTRTFKVRLETKNPHNELRPDMFVDLELPVQLPATITVPVDAVLHSGMRQTVFVERAKGVFEPRQIQTGWQMGDRIEVIQGLVPDERIVVAGNFFVNSESRLQAAAQGIYGAMSVDPVCGMEVDETRAKASGNTSEFQEQMYYFCTADCKVTFDKDPGPYVNKTEDSQTQTTQTTQTNSDAQDDQAVPSASETVSMDPVCGMEVDETQAEASGNTSQYEGQTYYFCTADCKATFDKDPGPYVNKTENSQSESMMVHPETHGDHAVQSITGTISMDPVCGIQVDETQAEASGNTSEYRGQIYYFSTADCKAAFDKDPEPFINNSQVPQTNGTMSEPAQHGGDHD